MTGRPRKLRRAGSPWRILVHRVLPGRGGYSDMAYHVASDRTFGGRSPDTEHSKNVELPGTEFDELVIGRWMHLEQMDTGVWWMNIGGVTVLVRADRDGRPQRVSVFGPLDYGSPAKGCEYELTWTDLDSDRRPVSAALAPDLSARELEVLHRADEHRCATPGCRARISPEYVRCIDCERMPGWHTGREVDTPEAIARAEIEAHAENKQRREEVDG